MSAIHNGVEVLTRVEFWERHDAIWRESKTPKEDSYKLHRDYWGRYVKAFNVKPPMELVAACRAAIQAGDEYMNSPYTQLPQWDRYYRNVFDMNIPMHKALKASGESWSLSTHICILKEAMRQHLER